MALLRNRRWINNMTLLLVRIFLWFSVIWAVLLVITLKFRT